MPKLDMTNEPSQSLFGNQTTRIPNSQSTTNRPPVQQSQARQVVPPPPVRHQVIETENLWDEEDEEVFMVASQVLDAQPDSVISQAMNFTSVNELTFNHFRREVEASTQLSAPQTNHNDIDDFMRSDDDEDIFTKLPDFSNLNQPKAQVVDVPAVVERQDDDVNRKKMAQREAQTKFLQNRIREQRKEIDRLKDNNTKTSDRCIQKEGEASSLRYELQLRDQQVDRLRREKIAEVNALEKQLVEKVSALEKVIDAQKSEIEFKVSF